MWAYTQRGLYIGGLYMGKYGILLIDPSERGARGQFDQVLTLVIIFDKVSTYWEPPAGARMKHLLLKPLS